MLPDLISIVFTLTNPEPVSLPPDQGRALSAAFLSWVQALDPALSEQLHDPNAIPRPYTVSNLTGVFPNQKGRLFLKRDSEVWFRVTSASSSLTKFLITEAIPSLEKQEVLLSNSKFIIKDLTWNPDLHPWAGGTTYENLIRTDLLGKAQPRVPIFFASPTSFHSHGVHVSFPFPELVLNSWIHSWNVFSSMTVPAALMDDVQESVGISCYKMKSETVRYGKATFIGGVGNCTYIVLSQDPYWQQMINVLASFAFYTGTGIKTTIGLGQTRRQDTRHYQK